MLSGLCHGYYGTNVRPKQLESLSLGLDTSNSKELGSKIVEVIQCTPSLNKLTLNCASEHGKPQYQSWIDLVLQNLHGPECTGLVTLELQGVVLPSQHVNKRAALTTAANDQINTTLKTLILKNVTFAHESSVQLLWSLKGLTQLDVSLFPCLRSAAEEVAEKVCETIDAVDYWAEYIRQCTELRKVCIHICDNDDDGGGASSCSRMNSRMFASILKGARGHETLQDLTLTCDGTVRVQVGPLIQQLLGGGESTCCLQKLTIDDIGPEEDFAAGLAEGLRGNRSLKKLELNLATLHPMHFRTILESLFENQTLRHFGNHSKCNLLIFYGSHTSHDICETFSRLFRDNKSLRHIALPGLDLQGGNMNVLIQGLGSNTTLRFLDFKNCKIDDAGLGLLGQALVVDNTSHPPKRIVACRGPVPLAMFHQKEKLSL
jgi:hypothetical protein